MTLSINKILKHISIYAFLCLSTYVSAWTSIHHKIAIKKHHFVIQKSSQKMRMKRSSSRFSSLKTNHLLFANKISSEASSSSSLKNNAIVFIKPHAIESSLTIDFVRKKLLSAGCSILDEFDVDSKQIQVNIYIQ